MADESEGSERGEERKPHVPGARGSRMVTRDALVARAQQRKADVERQLEATRAQLEATNDRLTARSGRNLVSATLIKNNLPNSSALMVQAVIIIAAVWAARERGR